MDGDYARLLGSLSGDNWRDQRLADFVVDWYVNAGRPAIRALQWAAHVQADGIVGSKTLRAVNKAPSAKLLQTLLVARKAFLHQLGAPTAGSTPLLARLA